VRKVYRFLCFAFVLCSGLYSCLKPETQKNNKTPLEDLAASDEVAGYLKAFQGRGALTDGSAPTPANQSLNRFRHPDDLSISLVLSEPQITQPVDISFDHRGRLWVVQYNQYPFPKGVKITGVDNHMRLNFDKVPLPPPVGEKGADKITMFEDTDGDGRFDKSTDVISGLNIAEPPLPAGLPRRGWRRSARRQTCRASRGFRARGHTRRSQQPLLGTGRMALRRSGEHGYGQSQLQGFQKCIFSGTGDLAIPS
jgi:hypothetical protein